MGKKTQTTELRTKLDTDSFTFKDVVGFDEVKDFINERLKYYYEEQELNERIGYKPQRGLLLYGDPGVGKTMFLNAMMNEFKDSPYFDFDISSASKIRSSSVGGGEDNIHSLFKSLRKKEKDTVLMLDEFSSLFPKNTSSILALERIDVFLSEYDGIYEKGKGSKVFVIATTNNKHGINDAILRSGRFDASFEISKPNRKQRLKLLEMYVLKMKDTKSEERLVSDEIYNEKQDIAKMCKGMTGADFALLGQKLQIIYKKTLIVKFLNNRKLVFLQNPAEMQI